MLLVDELRSYPRAAVSTKRRGAEWCHLVSDTSLEELHAFAAQLGLQRGWFQQGRSVPHYDITASKRRLALRLGAQPTSFRTLWKVAVRA